MLDPGPEPHQCCTCAITWIKWFSFHAGVAPKVNLWERTSHTPLPSANKAEPNLALKPRGDVTKNPKQGYE